jgi:hypothetical protein
MLVEKMDTLPENCGTRFRFMAQIILVVQEFVIKYDVDLRTISVNQLIEFMLADPFFDGSSEGDI